jgi:hypothetical protein
VDSNPLINMPKSVDDWLEINLKCPPGGSESYSIEGISQEVTWMPKR